MSATAAVHLWGRTIGAVTLPDGAEHASFQYTPEFARSGIEVAPLTMPLASRPYTFRSLALESFHGLPGLLADSLPDRYGHALIDAWLAGQGRAPESFNVIERLCYVGRRGMGALEFHPIRGPRAQSSSPVHLAALVELASEVLADRERLVASLAEGHREAAMREILRVGTSAGGARAKAVIAYNPASGELRSGQVDAPSGFEHWLLKLDGVQADRDRENLGDPQGHGAVEYAYHRMALDAGIQMSECRLLEENGRSHFMTRRFDRDERGAKLHMLSLGATAHLDFNQAGAHSYEQAFMVIRRLGMDAQVIAQQFRRMVFNILARNQDDHVKNIAFLMGPDGVWRLSPAFDLTYAYRPRGRWTGRHQMSVGGKREGFTLADLRTCAKAAGLRRGAERRMVGEVAEVLSEWPRHAAEAGVGESRIRQIARAHHLQLPAA